MSGIRAAKLTLSLTHKRVFHQSFTAESVKTRYGFRFRESFCPKGRMAEQWNGGMAKWRNKRNILKPEKYGIF